MSKVNAVYIHIPFCDSICSYCDFSKMFYNETLVDKYLDALENEIKEKYKKEVINTIYIGGGTPSSLNIKQLKKLFDITKIFKVSNIEFTFECNIENIDEEKIILLKNNNVNRISIGIQTFNEKQLKFLNRHHKKEEAIEKVKMIKKYIKNINVDLIYALKDEILKDLEEDLNIYLSLDIPHISTYSLIIEEHTSLYNDSVENIDEELDYEMYELICNKLKEHNYNHYEISNFSKLGYESKHNLTYWNNLEYYGFGLGASGYLNNARYDNTRSINNYILGNYQLNSHKLDKKETIENEFILGFRKLEGINIEDFKNKYNIDPLSLDTVKKLLNEEKLLLKNRYIFINPKYIYTSNNILIDFL